jgi:hypothetical protein
MLGIETVPIVARPFLWDKMTPSMVKEYILDCLNRDGKEHEGYVVRNADGFDYKDFSTNVAKYVRKNHVQTDTHWMHSQVVPNKLK